MPVTREVVVSALDQGEWRRFDAVAAGGALGSIGYADEGGRQRLLVYGWEDGRPGVWRSPVGRTIEPNEPVFSAAGLELVADLSDGHAESLVISSDGEKVTYRFVVQ